MHPDRSQWKAHARALARKLLQSVYDEYAAQDDEVSAGVVERVMQLFHEEFLSRDPGERRGSDSVSDEILALHEQGLSTGEIARELHVTYPLVRYRLIAMGLTPHAGKRGGWQRVNTPAQAKAHERDAELLDLYNRGMSIPMISDLTKVTHQRVHQRLTRILKSNLRDDAVQAQRASQQQVISIADDTDTWLKQLDKKDDDVK